MLKFYSFPVAFMSSYNATRAPRQPAIDDIAHFNQQHDTLPLTMTRVLCHTHLILDAGLERFDDVLLKSLIPGRFFKYGS